MKFAPKLIFLLRVPRTSLPPKCAPSLLQLLWLHLILPLLQLHKLLLLLPVLLLLLQCLLRVLPQLLCALLQPPVLMHCASRASTCQQAGKSLRKLATIPLLSRMPTHRRSKYVSSLFKNHKSVLKENTIKNTYT